MKSVHYIIFTLSFLVCKFSNSMDKDNVQQNPYPIFEMPKKIIKSYTHAYSMAFTLTFIHEFGHWITNKALLGRKGIILINPLQILPLDGSLVTYNTSLWKYLKELSKTKNHIQRKQIIENYVHNNKIPQGIRSALMFFSGPLFGFFGSIGFLKGSTIYAEYKRNENQLDKAFNYGIHQPLFNKDQSLITQLIAAWSMVGNTLQLIPFKGSDGWHIFSNFKINPQTQFKMVNGIAGGSFTLIGLLTYQIYKAHK
jgi:hypothetical protein